MTLQLDDPSAPGSDGLRTATNPALSGHLVADTPQAGITIKFQYAYGDVTAADPTAPPAATATTDANGEFHLQPTGLHSGKVTIYACATQQDAVTAKTIDGAWVPLTFHYEAAVAPSVDTLNLTTASATDSAGRPLTADATLTGTLSGDGSLSNVKIEFDLVTTSNGQAVYTSNGYTFSNSGGALTYLPRNLTPGVVTIAARTVVWDSSIAAEVHGGWNSVTFDYSVVPGIGSLTLANADGTPGTDHLPVTDDPTLTGSLAGSNIANTVVVFDA